MPKDAFTSSPTLPDELPPEPFSILRGWLDEAEREGRTPNPNAVSLATVDESGAPAVRVVLCKELDAERGSLVFFTNRRSDKGRHIGSNPRAEALFFWDDAARQARIGGPVEAVSDAESDAYFASRALISRVGAWASDQSKPIGSRAALLEKAREVEARFGVGEGQGDGHIPRPPHWGGYRLWAQRVELWLGSSGRLHDRALWSRTVSLSNVGAPELGAWSPTRLQP